jgi:hypothetical protein
MFPVAVQVPAVLVDDCCDVDGRAASRAAVEVEASARAASANNALETAAQDLVFTASPLLLERDEISTRSMSARLQDP